MLTASSRIDRITVNPEVCHGKPTIRRMRIRVQDVLEMLAPGMSDEEILTDDDELGRDDILAVLEFAALDSTTRLHRTTPASSASSPDSRIPGMVAFLIDQQLPARLAAHLVRLGHAAKQVKEYPGGPTMPDAATAIAYSRWSTRTTPA